MAKSKKEKRYIVTRKVLMQFEVVATSKYDAKLKAQDPGVVKVISEKITVQND